MAKWTGMLMTYGASNVALFRRAVYFVDRILKGTGAEDLPDEQPTTIEPAPPPAVGFAVCSMPLTTSRCGRCPPGSPGLRSVMDSVRRPRLERNVLHYRDEAQRDERYTGTAWERTPWHATQRTAWEALKVESSRPA